VAHVEDGVCKGIKQVVTHHDPDDLNRLRCPGHGKEQYAGDRHKRRGEQQPRSCLALFCAGAVNDAAHDHVGGGVDELADNGENHEKRAAPHACEVEHIGVVDVEIGRQHRIEKQSARGPQQVAQPFFFCGDVVRTDPARREAAFNGHSRAPPKYRRLSTTIVPDSSGRVLQNSRFYYMIAEKLSGDSG